MFFFNFYVQGCKTLSDPWHGPVQALSVILGFKRACEVAVKTEGFALPKAGTPAGEGGQVVEGLGLSPHTLSPCCHISSLKNGLLSPPPALGAIFESLATWCVSISICICV